MPRLWILFRFFPAPRHGIALLAALMPRFPAVFGMLPEGQGEGNEVKGLFKVICCALVGHSPAPHGPHCPSEGSGRHGKGGTPKLSCSTRLQSYSSEPGPVPDAPVPVGMEKAVPAVPSGDPAVPGPLEELSASRTGTAGPRGCSGITWGQVLAAGISTAQTLP